MCQCRFYKGAHSYDPSECDVDYCREILPKSKKRRVPLPEGHNPECCEHNWDVLYVRMKSHIGKMAPSRRFAVTDDGKIEITERILYVCEHCGAVKYTHEEIGDILCVPCRGK